MTRKYHRHQRSKWRSLYIWHRYLGLIAALVVILISITGLLLNHTEELKLDERYTTNESLLDIYGIKQSSPISFNADKNWFSLIDQRLYLNTLQLDLPDTNNLVGAIKYQDVFVLATDAEIHLLTNDGEVIETLAISSDMPAAVTAIGLTAINIAALRTATKTYILNQDLTEITPAIVEDSIIWSAASELPANLQQQIKHNNFSTALPVERVLLDLHSGRLFGSLGIYAFDLFTLIFLFLSLSGVTIWFKQHLKYRQHQRKLKK